MKNLVGGGGGGRKSRSNSSMLSISKRSVIQKVQLAKLLIIMKQIGRKTLKLADVKVSYRFNLNNRQLG